jgi:sec-independent protein translocase protein TatA
MIPGVPSMGGMELLIILAIILLFFGAGRIPQLGRSLGQSLREFRKVSSEDPEDNESHQLKERRALPLEEEEAELARAHAARTEHDEDVRDGRRATEHKL